MSAANVVKVRARVSAAVLVDFWAPWCVWCRRLMPTIEDIAHERSDVRVVTVNVDEQPELARRFGVSRLPTLKFLCGRRVVREIVGALPRAEIERALDAAKGAAGCSGADAARA